MTETTAARMSPAMAAVLHRLADPVPVLLADAEDAAGDLRNQLALATAKGKVSKDMIDDLYEIAVELEDTITDLARAIKAR